MKEPFAVIAGSSGYNLLGKSCLGIEQECKKILTPFGESSPIHRFSKDGFSMLFLSRHGEKKYSLSAPFVNYRANIWALKECGVERIIAWSGPGIINDKFSVGNFALPHDLIDETKNRDYTFFENKGIGFIRQKFPFCEIIRKELVKTMTGLNLEFHAKSVYVCTQGPRLETPAEIQKYKMFGGDIVGMTLIPEAFLARELEICYAPICYLTNFAEGTRERPYQKGELFEGMIDNNDRKSISDSLRQFPIIFQKVYGSLQNLERDCDCKNAMLRYRKEGCISEDWRNWIK